MSKLNKMSIEVTEQTYHLLIGLLVEKNLPYEKLLKVNGD